MSKYEKTHIWNPLSLIVEKKYPSLYLKMESLMEACLFFFQKTQRHF